MRAALYYGLQALEINELISKAFFHVKGLHEYPKGLPIGIIRNVLGVPKRAIRGLSYELDHVHDYRV